MARDYLELPEEFQNRKFREKDSFSYFIYFVA